MQYKGQLINDVLSNDPKTQVVDFSNIDLNQDDLKLIIQGLSRNTHLTSLNLLETGITEQAIKPLHTAIMGNHNLTYLQIQTYNDYGDDTKKLIQEMETHVENNKLLLDKAEKEANFKL